MKSYKHLKEARESYTRDLFLKKYGHSSPAEKKEEPEYEWVHPLIKKRWKRYAEEKRKVR